MDILQAVVTETGMVVCGCSQFLSLTKAQIRKGHARHCQHTDDLRKTGKYFKQLGEYYFVITRDKIAERYTRLLQPFEFAVQALEGMTTKARFFALSDVELAKFPIEAAVLYGPCPPDVREKFLESNKRLRELIQEIQHG
jgi:hypothetical protein